MNRSVEQSFKSRVRTISAVRRVPTQELWEILALERLLVRIALSRHSDKFVFKGGALLSRYVDIGRHTQDLDFSLRHLRCDPEVLTDVLREIIELPIGDGFCFFGLVVSSLSHPRMRYAGARVLMRATFGKTRFRVMVDVGVGDLVEPIECSFPLLGTEKGPLFESHVEMTCYPKEFIFAEKLETVVGLGGRNSRMKDFHDLYVLTRSGLCDEVNLGRIVRSVFEHRQTSLRLPLFFTETDLVQMQALWSRHLTSGLSDAITLPLEIRVLIMEVNEWLRAATDLCDA